jgi:hypothetical protein
MKINAMSLKTAILNVIIVAIIVCPQLSFSQITITQADIASANTQVILSTESPLNISLSQFDSAGPNQTWNFGSFNFTSQDTLQFSAPSSTSYLLLNNSFVSTYANKGVFSIPAIPNFPSITDVTDFFKKSSAELKQVGVGVTLSGIPIPTFYNPTDRVFKFPENYLNVDSSTSKFSFQIPTLGYYGANIKRKNKADAWGTLTTPFGTFQTLRVVSEIDRIDSLKLDTLLPFGFSFPRPKTFEYKWLANNKKYPLLIITTTMLAGIEVISNIEYQDSARSVGVSNANSNSKSNIKLNHLSEGHYRLSNEGNTNGTQIFLFDLQGKLIDQKNWSLREIELNWTMAQTVVLLVIDQHNNIQTFKLAY